MTPQDTAAEVQRIRAVAATALTTHHLEFDRWCA